MYQTKVSLHDPDVRCHSKQTRIKRFCFILSILIAGYFVLNYYFDLKMILVNYVSYPFALLFIIKLLCNKNDGTCVEYKLYNILGAIVKLALSLSFIAIMMAWMQACFISGTILELTESNQKSDLVQIVTHFFKQSYLIVPWLMIVASTGFLAICVQNFKIYNISDLAHRLTKSKLQNDTIHNFIRIVYSAPYLASIVIVFTMSIYAFYSAIMSVLHLYPIKGVTVATLVFAVLTIMVSTRKKLKESFRYYHYHKWPLSKMFFIIGLVYVFWLIVPTVIINLVVVSPQGSLIGPYFHDNDNVKLQFLFLLWGSSWLITPIVSYMLYQKLVNYHYKLQIVICFLAMVMAYYLINSTIILQYLEFILAWLLSLGTGSLVFFNVASWSLFVVLYHSKLLKGLSIENFDVSQSSKDRANGIMYYLFFLLVATALCFIMLENVFIIYKFIAFMSIISSLLFLYFISFYRRLSSKT